MQLCPVGLPAIWLTAFGNADAAYLSWCDEVRVACPTTWRATEKPFARLDPERMDVDPTLLVPANGYHPCGKGLIQFDKATDGVAGTEPEEGVNPLWAREPSA